MRAIKGNREYKITEAEKNFYQKQGFDIIGDDGVVIQYGAGKTVPYEQYKKVVDELEALKKDTEHTEHTEHADNKELEDMTKAELEKMADTYFIAHNSKTTKEELIKLINEALETAGQKVEGE